MAAALVLLNACGEGIFDNTGSRTSLVEGKRACAVEMTERPTAPAYRQNPAAHPDHQDQRRLRT